MSIRIRISVENHKAMLPAMNNASLFVTLFRSVAENAARHQISARNIRIAPRSPQVIHHGRVAEKRREPRATGRKPEA